MQDVVQYWQGSRPGLDNTATMQSGPEAVMYGRPVNNPGGQATPTPLEDHQEADPSSLVRPHAETRGIAGTGMRSPIGQCHVLACLIQHALLSSKHAVLEASAGPCINTLLLCQQQTSMLFMQMQCRLPCLCQRPLCIAALSAAEVTCLQHVVQVQM